MNEAQLAELATKTMRIIEKLGNEVMLDNISTEQEINILSNMAPVILSELIAVEKARS